MAAGRVLRFDPVRGFGFIVSPDSDEDVFMHAQDLLEDEILFRSGTSVTFELVPGDRGPKAEQIRLSPHTVQADLAGEDPGLRQKMTSDRLREDLTDLLVAGADSLTAVQIRVVRELVCSYSERRGLVRRL